ncbi:MAG: hypothetical protein DRJ55_01580 [Thermoprotei archaeon]|nr:MAG: hypothetical protein DRJ55_01580 [Thermoprotei archaeon]
MLEVHKTPTEAARMLGISHTAHEAPCQSEARSRAKSLRKALKPSLRSSKLCSVDFTFLPAFGKSLAGHLRRGGLKMLVAYTPGRAVIAVGPEGPAESPADTLEKLLEELPRGSVLVADAEFSSRRCLELLLEKLDEGALAGFLVRANRRWHAELWERLGREPYGVPVKYAGRELYAWRVLLKTRGGAVGAMLISTSPGLGPELYRWRVELLFRSAKELMPPCRLRSLEGRLLLFAVALLAAVLAELFGGLPALRRCLGRLLYPGWGRALLRRLTAAWPA